MSTLKDIARRVGVSISTVSRVINNDTSRRVNRDTTTKVWQAVRELGYEPNESARSLVRNVKERSRASMQIGCLVAPTLLNGNTHPYFSPIIAGLSQKLVESGYSLAFVVNHYGNSETENTLTRMIQDQRIDGIIVIGWIDKELLSYIQSTSLPLVGISTSGLDIPLVDYDRIPAAKSAVEHLITQGHKRIGFVGGSGHTNDLDSEERYLGYKYALLEAGIPLNQTWIFDTGWKVEASYELIAKLYAGNRSLLPTAIFAASDQLAIPAMSAVIERGLRIPNDVAFMSMDNIELAQYTTPPLSSVHVPKHEIGLQAAKTLLDQIGGQQPILSKILLPHQFVFRQSSGRMDSLL